MPHDAHRMSMGWGRFAAMIAVSTAIMFALMYHLVYEPAHVLFSLTRLLGAFIMGAVMTVIMLAFMWRMYQGIGTKVMVMAGAALVAVGLLWMNRGQVLVGDEAFMQAMIPHHSIAINNARKARISDPRVRALADGIIAGQVKEIREMKLLLEDIDRHGERGGTPLPPRPAEVTPDMLPEIQRAVE